MDLPERPIAAALLAGVALACPADAGEAAARVRLDGFVIDATEVTIGRFREHAKARGVPTHAEASGGGYEYAAGWEQRPGWTWSSPYGQPGADDEPAVHVTWHEARAFCESAGGRLPSFDEWRRAAYEEMRAEPTDDFVRGRTYPFPVGDRPDGMNASGDDPWPRHAPSGATKRGVNGLYDMGANVWEWQSDRDGDTALTAGGSWWYGAFKTRVDGAQYKPADFAAVYIGFRCAYGLEGG
jgi:formylglycine-generating enzyme required for sulfatase activity